jgi:hypothetical protein
MRFNASRREGNVSGARIQGFDPEAWIELAAQQGAT